MSGSELPGYFCSASLPTEGSLYPKEEVLIPKMAGVGKLP
jgi:hypothetical protein